MALSNLLILILLLVTVSFLYEKRKVLILLLIDAFLSYDKRKNIKRLMKSPLSPLYNWDLLDDLNQESIYVAWSEIFTSRLINLDREKVKKYSSWGKACKSLLAEIGRDYNLEDIVIVFWSSPPDSWKHLAGRAGYVFISKKEKKQIGFILTCIS